MKQEMQDTKVENVRTGMARIKLNDIAFRLIAIPLCGIAIPLITRMADFSTWSHLKVKLAFLATIGISLIIFLGNRYLHNTLRSYFDWYNKPYQKILALLIVIPFYTIPVSVLLLVIWYQLFNQGVIPWPVVKQTTLVIMLAVVFIVHIYETIFLVKEAESEKLQNAQIEKARVQAELDALKNQIDPHFMFNSLNTLSHLIEKYPDRAVQFNDHLADVFRYILTNKSRDLVLLHEELSFLEDYFALIRIRFANAAQLEIDIPEDRWDRYLVPPISLQIPAENAIKHNEFSDDQPLQIRLSLFSDDVLLFSNPMQPKKQIRDTSKIGLDNLGTRYRLITGKEIRIRSDTKTFQVFLPVLPV
jgi:sensor histidine kinase YesM